MRRGLILGGVWALGVAVALTLAFAAVGRVANGVAPHDVARLSSAAIDNELTGPTVKPASPSTGATKPTTRPSTSAAVTTSSSSTSTTSTTRSTVVGPTTASTTTTTAPPPTVPTTKPTAPPVAPHNTVTTAQGGTVFTRCSGAATIVYVAAVPKSGFERTVDVEGEGGIQQVFVNANHRSQIEAQCSGGVVHAHVDEESVDE